MPEPSAKSRRVIIRDLLIFHLKLVADGAKDTVLVPVSFVAALMDLTRSGPRRGRYFYGILRASERFDLWLNLYAASSLAEDAPGGLFGLDDHARGGFLAEIKGLIAPDESASPAHDVPLDLPPTA